MAGTQYLTHTGTYRLYGRVYSTSGTAVQARAVWDVGDLVNPAENDALAGSAGRRATSTSTTSGRFVSTPLRSGPTAGRDRSRPRVTQEGRTSPWTSSGWFRSDEGMGVLTAPFTDPRWLATYSARGEFNTESGAVTGKTRGGRWELGRLRGTRSTSDGCGTPTTAQEPVTDVTVIPRPASLITASAARLTTPTAIVVVERRLSPLLSALASSLDYTNAPAVLRCFGDTDNWLQGLEAALHPTTTASQSLIPVDRRCGCVVTPAGDNGQPRYTMRAHRSTWRWPVVVRLYGRLSVLLLATGSDSALATGGALASGTVGIYDCNDAAQRRDPQLRQLRRLGHRPPMRSPSPLAPPS